MKSKMSASYKIIFAISILMIFVVIILAAAAGSKSAGIGVWYWGYTAWGMYKRNNSGLASFHKFFMWFDIAILGLIIVIFGFVSDVKSYTTYDLSAFLVLASISVAIAYALTKYFTKQEQITATIFEDSSSVNAASNMPVIDKESDTILGLKSSSLETALSEQEVNYLYAKALDEVERGDLDRGLWAKCFSEAGGNESQAKAKYIELRVAGLSDSALDDKKSNDIQKILESLTGRANNGDLSALIELGLINYKGLYNQPRQLVAAFDCFKKAAYLGSARGQYMLSLMFWNGEGTSKNKTYAHAWAVIASSQNSDAKSNVVKFQREMRAEEVFQSDDLVRSLRRKIFINGSSEDASAPIQNAVYASEEPVVNSLPSSSTAVKKYWIWGIGLLILGAASLGVFKEFFVQGGDIISFNRKKAYDFYVHTNWDDCNSAYKDKPIMTMEFMFNEQSKEIIAKIDYDDDGVKKQDFTRLEPCSVVDGKNWSCGGNILANGSIAAKYILADGEFSYRESSYAKCPAKIIAR